MVAVAGIVARPAEWAGQRTSGFAGAGIDPLLASLDRASGSLELVTARHVATAAFMAAGHATCSGDAPRLAPGSGPAAGHLDRPRAHEAEQGVSAEDDA